MKTLLRILLAVTIAALTVGPASAATVTSGAGVIVAQAAATGSVSGSFLDPAGSPVANATVRLAGPSAYTTTTDSKGAFSVANVAPGIYVVTAQKAGYGTAEVDDLAVLSGTNSTVNATMQPVTFSSIREIARVTANRGTRFNTSTASSSVVSAQQFVNQAQPQVQRVLDQTPGIVIDHPGTSATNASPGAITFPSIRGGLGFETASFIDGHPLSVGAFGDYVTTFLNAYALQGAEIIKGPGSFPDEIAYAIGGTANFRTKDPTAKPTGQILLGAQSNGGTFANYGYSSTTSNGKFGWLLDYAVNDFEGPQTNGSRLWDLPGGFTYNGQQQVGFTTNAAKYPNVANNPFAYSSTAVACCFAVSQIYINKTELAKVRYKFSDATVLTASYLGSQTWTDQNGNHLYGLDQVLAPCGLNGASPNGASANACPGYAGTTYATGSKVATWQNIFPPQGEWEVNNEPIFQGELRTTMGKDTILGRYYTASINRLQYNALDNPNQSFTQVYNIYGSFQTCNVATVGGKCPAGHTVTNYSNGAPSAITINNSYFRATEEDRLHGLTFEYDHPFGNENLLTVSYDSSSSGTKAYGYSPTLSVSIPDGARQRYGTLMARGIFQLGSKWRATLGNYFESFYERFSPDGGVTFLDKTLNRYDGRFGAEYRPNANISYRGAFGSAIAPPYANLLNANSSIKHPFPGDLSASGGLNNPNLQPESSIGFDLGADYRFGSTNDSVFSWDVYQTNLRNQFVTSNIVDPNCPFVDKTTVACSPTQVPNTIPLFRSQPQNLATSRYSGIEASLKKSPLVGFGYTLQGALLRAYAYNIDPCFYAAPVFNSAALDCTKPRTNLGYVNNINFQGSGPSGSNTVFGSSGSGFFGIANSAIPYAQAYLELNHTWASGMYASFGEQLYGHNNSLLVPAFWVANATLRAPMGKQMSVQGSIDNVFNAYPNTYTSELAGVPATLVNGQIGITNANVIGPRNFRLILTTNFGSGP